MNTRMVKMMARRWARKYEVPSVYPSRTMAATQKASGMMTASPAIRAARRVSRWFLVAMYIQASLCGARRVVSLSALAAARHSAGAN